MEMNKEFRIATFSRILKTAGIVTDMVQESLSKKEKPTFKTLGSVGPGTTVMVPQNPVKLDGSVDIVIQIRGISGGDTKTASALGGNAVIITCEAGGLGSKENFAAYSSPNFVNTAVEKVLSFLQKEFPDKQIKRGKLAVSSFSGGGSATSALLMNRDKIKGGVDKFVFIDGLHVSKDDPRMKALVDYAKEIKEDPSKGQLDIVHTAVQPSGYASTTETANHILNELGLNKRPVDKWTGNGPPPSAQAQQGGLRVTELYSEPAPYMAKDPKTGKLKANVPGTAGWQHIQALNWGLKNSIF